MSLGFHEQREARRRRWRLIRWLTTIGFIVAMGALSYITGSELAALDVAQLELKVDELNKTVTALRERDAALQEQTEAAKATAADWRARYEKEVPTGRSLDLYRLVEAQLAAGADPGRIEFLVGTAAREQKCDNAPMTKRFLVRTPISVGAMDVVTFADGAVVVTAEGTPAANAEGNPEAWFDAGQPVMLRFTEPGGKTTEATGMLPLYHSVVRGNSEYRFNATAATRLGFVSVTSDRCAFP